MLTSRGLGAVLGDLASMGFDAKWGVLGAADIGANHQRDRIWIRGEATDPNRIGLQKSTHECQLESQGSNQLQVEQSRNTGQMANPDLNRLHGGQTEWDRESQWSICTNQSDNRSEIRSEVDRCSQSGSEEEIPNTQVVGLQRQGQHEQSIDSKASRQGKADGLIYGRSSDFWSIEPNVGRVANGVAARVDRIKAIGNGQVPLCAASAWRILK